MDKLIANADHARQAVETSYRGPTNSRGSRIIVKAQCGRMTVAWDHALAADENHAAAAEAFIRARGWADWSIWLGDGPAPRGRWVMGANVKGDGYVFAFDTSGKAGV